MVSAYNVGERIRGAIAEMRITTDGEPSRTLRVTASFGIASYPESKARDGEDLVRKADRALYRAKKTGKNRVELYWSDDSGPGRPARPRAVDAGRRDARPRTPERGRPDAPGTHAKARDAREGLRDARDTEASRCARRARHPRHSRCARRTRHPEHSRCRRARRHEVARGGEDGR
jgi:hypothetical protein